MFQATLLMGGHGEQIYTLLPDTVRNDPGRISFPGQFPYLQARYLFRPDDRIDLFPAPRELFPVIVRQNH